MGVLLGNTIQAVGRYERIGTQAGDQLAVSARASKLGHSTPGSIHS